MNIPLAPKPRIAITNTSRQMASVLRLVPELAEAIGLNESIMLMQLEFWISIVPDKNYIDGHWWTYQSVRGMQQKAFPYWSPATINRTITSLEKKGLIITANYNKRKGDSTRWFALNEAAVAQLLAPLSGVHFVTERTPPFQNGTPLFQNGTTLPENTPERTTENTTEKNKILPASPVTPVGDTAGADTADAGAPVGETAQLNVKAGITGSQTGNAGTDFEAESHVSENLASDSDSKPGLSQEGGDVKASDEIEIDLDVVQEYFDKAVASVLASKFGEQETDYRVMSLRDTTLRVVCGGGRLPSPRVTLEIQSAFNREWHEPVEISFVTQATYESMVERDKLEEVLQAKAAKSRQVSQTAPLQRPSAPTPLGGRVIGAKPESEARKKLANIHPLDGLEFVIVTEMQRHGSNTKKLGDLEGMLDEVVESRGVQEDENTLRKCFEKYGDSYDVFVRRQIRSIAKSMGNKSALMSRKTVLERLQHQIPAFLYDADVNGLRNSAETEPFLKAPKQPYKHGGMQHYMWEILGEEPISG